MHSILWALQKRRSETIKQSLLERRRARSRAKEKTREEVKADCGWGRRAKGEKCLQSTQERKQDWPFSKAGTSVRVALKDKSHWVKERSPDAPATSNHCGVAKRALGSDEGKCYLGLHTYCLIAPPWASVSSSVKCEGWMKWLHHSQSMLAKGSESQ